MDMKVVIYLLLVGGTDISRLSGGGRLYQAQLVTASDVGISWRHTRLEEETGPVVTVLT